MDSLKERVTIYQVAQAAGVSLATVSRVINHQGNVTEKTRIKVEETIKRLGYKPSGLAQALATNRSTNIGIVIPSANYVYISNMLSGISDVAKEKGFSLTLFTTSHSHLEAVSAIERVITTHVDGAIIFDDELDEGDIMKINSYSVPIIAINKRIVADKVGCINLSYSQQLSDLIEDYYRRGGDKEMTFLHVHDAGKLSSTLERTFIAVHERLGRPYHTINVDDSYTNTYSDFIEYFSSNRKGYFICYRDSIAMAVENAATDNGLKVPDDVEVLSIVGTKYANIARPSLSSFQISMQEVGKRAMYMLIDLINQELNEKSYEFDPVLVKRNSTKF